MGKPVVLGGDRLVSEKIRACSTVLPRDVSELESELNDLFKSGMITCFAKYMRELERQLSETLKVKHAIAVSNGTAGLQILLLTLPKDSEVLVPSYTFPSTVHAIALANLKLKFVDIDRETCNINLQEVKYKITKNTKAILAVNTFGNPCHINELKELADQYKLKLFFDSAAAIGSKYYGHPLGSFGDAEVFSLSGTKVVTAGEGGVITTDNEDLAQKLDCIRNYGYSKREKDCLYIGCNGKMSDLNAIIALWSLRNMWSDIAWRRKIAETYYDRLKKNIGIHFQKINEKCETNFCAFAIEVDPQKFGLDATSVQECLKEDGIETLRYFCPPMHKTRAYKDFNHLRLEQSEILSERNLCLPMHAHLKIEQAQAVCTALERIHAFADEITHKRTVLGNRKQTHHRAKQTNFSP